MKTTIFALFCSLFPAVFIQASESCQAPFDVVQPRVPDRLDRLTLNQQELGGEIDRRIKNLIYQNYVVVDLDGKWLNHFRNRTDRGGRQYVYYGIGKVFDAEPVRDDSIGPNGLKVAAKAWLNQECTGEKVDVTLTELIDPSGQDVYFCVPDLADTSPLRLTDDEIVSWRNDFVNAHVLKAFYGPKATGDLEAVFEIRGDVVGTFNTKDLTVGKCGTAEFVLRLPPGIVRRRSPAACTRRIGECQS